MLRAIATIIIAFAVYAAILIIIFTQVTLGAEAKRHALRPLAEGTCENVRQGVATYGHELALRWARENLTSVQIMQARRCLKQREKS